MAFAYLNAFIEIDDNDMSDAVRSAQLSIDSNAIDANTMGSTWAQFIGGVKSANLDVEFNDDFDAGKVDAILWPLLGDMVTFKFRPDAGAIGVNNPQYSGTVHVGGHGVGGSHGDLATKTISFQTSGDVTRATA